MRDSGGPAGIPDIVVSGNVVEIPTLHVNFTGAHIGIPGDSRSHIVAVTRFVDREAARLRGEIDAGLPSVFPLKSSGGLATTLSPAVDLYPVFNPPQTWGDWFVSSIGIGRSLSASEQADLRFSRVNDRFDTGAALANPPGSSGRYIIVLGRDDLQAVWGGGGINGFSNHKGGLVATDVNFRTVAHEIAHTTGRSGDSLGWLFSTDEMTRDCSLDYHNKPVQVGHGFRIGPNNDRTRFRDDYHMMVAMRDDPPWWISQCTYWHLVHRLQAPLDPPVIQVRGFASRVGGENGAAILPAYRMDGVVELEQGTGEWNIVLQDQGGNELGSFPFEPTWTFTTHNADHEHQVRDLVITSFGHQVPDLPGTARIEIQGPDGEVLDTRVFSSNPPSVAVRR